MSFNSSGYNKVKKNKIKDVLRSVFLGKRYSELKSIDEQARYMTMNAIFMVAMIPLIILGTTLIGIDFVRTFIDYGIAFLCLVALILMRTRVPLRIIPIVPVTLFGLYCLYLLYTGGFNLWAAVWLFTFPPIVIFLCRMTVGVIESVISFIVTALIMYVPGFMQVTLEYDEIKMRVVGGYFLIIALTIIYERVSILKTRKETALSVELEQERDVVQTMKDNIHQGIFLMDADFKILPQYSKPLITILSYYEAELAGKNFLDILAASLDSKQLQTMKGYFSMIFSKSKSAKVLESVNPISEFEYNIDDRIKVLSTRFHLIEKAGSDSVIIGIIQDITREKEFERELELQKEVQEREMKNMFDVIQIDPMVFEDFIEDTEANFDYINSILKDKSLTEREVVTKFFQNVHAIKSNALVLGLETFGKKLHTLEDDIKTVLDGSEVKVEDVLRLAVALEVIMQEKDSYVKIINRIEAYKTSHQLDSVLLRTMAKAVEKVADETHKKVELKAEHLDISILESKLRKPIKDILFQCVRNSIYHGIETVEERVKKSKNPQGALSFSIKNVNGNAEIVFSDDGSGLDWEKIKTKYIKLNPKAKDVSKNILLSSIFSPEFSTSEETGMVAGRGVGLSLVKDIVKENGGTISVNSSDSGLSFKFVFPLK